MFSRVGRFAALSRGADDVRCVGGCASAADRQDRGDLSLERQRRECGRLLQGGHRAGRRHHQQRSSRAEGYPARRGQRPAGARRRQDRGDLRRQPGHSGSRPEPSAPPHHRGEGARAHRRLPIGHHGHHQRHGRAARHPLPDARIGGLQSDRARLQVVLPRHPCRRRLRPRLFRLPQGAEGGRPEDGFHCRRSREHGIRQLGRQRHQGRSSPRTATTSRR